MLLIIAQQLHCGIWAHMPIVTVVCCLLSCYALGDISPKCMFVLTPTSSGLINPESDVI